MALDLEDVVWPNGQNNDGGLATVLYVARKSDMTTIRWVPDSPADLEAKVTITTDHVFASGKCFKKVSCTLEKGQLVSNLVGERNSHSFENMATVGFAGNLKKALGLLEEFKNDDLIVLVKELNGQVRQLGWEDVPAHVETAETTTGQAVADFKGTNLTFKSIGRIAPVYEGAIQLTPA